MTDSNWTNEEEEAFNAVEKNSNLGKQILKDIQGQPYHWAAEATKAAVKIEREACAKLCEGRLQEGLNFEGCATAIRARGQA